MEISKSDEDSIELNLRGRISDVNFKLGLPQEQRTRFTLNDEKFSLIGNIHFEDRDYLHIIKRVKNQGRDEEIISYEIEKHEKGLPEGDVVAKYHQDYIKRKILFG